MKYKKIHLVGIKGVGMTPLAIICKQAGATVTGSDIAASFITDIPLEKAGITVKTGFNEKNIEGVDLVISTGAHGGKENIEVVKAIKLGIPIMTLAEALGHLLDGELLGVSKKGIAVSGTHGKTTTTALIATIFSQNKLDPTYFIGTSEISTLSSPGHYGKGEYAVIEADEYANDPKSDKTAKFLTLTPQVAVITNIDYDHVDIYDSLDEVREMFAKLLQNIMPSGVAIVYGDDREIEKITQDTDKRVITYGMTPKNDYYLKRVTISSGYTFFHVEGQGTDLGEFAVQIMGEHNALNALAAVIVSLEVGLPLDSIKKSLKTFSGSKRRFEHLGTLPEGALLYDDYAHHPTEIKKTLETFKKLFPRKKLVVIFQPHTYSRTKKLFEDFLRSFNDADEIIITDIYGSKREAIDVSVSAEALVQKLTLLRKDASTQKSLTDVVEYVKNKRYNEDYIVVTLGAGDIFQIAPSLLK